MVNFNMTLISYIIRRSKTKQFIKVINCDALMKICHKNCFLIVDYVVFVVVVVVVVAVLAFAVDVAAVLFG